MAPVPLPFVLTGEIALNVPDPLAMPSMLATVRELKRLDVMNALLGDVQKAKYLVNSGLLKLI